jgi:hypothetical protein
LKRVKQHDVTDNEKVARYLHVFFNSSKDNVDVSASHNGRFKANSHIPFRSHAAPMPFPYHAVPLMI